MADLQGRKVFKVFNQDFIVDERYNVTKELGQGAYGIVWYVPSRSSGHFISYVQGRWTLIPATSWTSLPFSTFAHT